MASYRCAGVIVFDETGKNMVIVKSGKDGFGFPKGKKEKKDKDNLYKTAFRELYEETGIKMDQVKIINEELLVEMSPAEKPAIGYLIGIFQGDISKHKFRYRYNELSYVKWCCIDEALNLLKKRKQRLPTLKSAIEILNQYFDSQKNGESRSIDNRLLIIANNVKQRKDIDNYSYTRRMFQLNSDGSKIEILTPNITK